jgi:hypothetical protein
VKPSRDIHLRRMEGGYLPAAGGMDLAHVAEAVSAVAKKAPVAHDFSLATAHWESEQYPARQCRYLRRDF